MSKIKIIIGVVCICVAAIFVFSSFRKEPKIEAEEKSNLVGASVAYFSPIPFRENVVDFVSLYSLLDIDLHAYSTDGRHIGMNYATGAYEIGIPGGYYATARTAGVEYIYVPSEIKTNFSIKCTIGLKSPWDGPVFGDNVNYDFVIEYVDRRGNRYYSKIIHGEISLGAEIFYSYDILRNPDGTYSVIVERL